MTTKAAGKSNLTTTDLALDAVETESRFDKINKMIIKKRDKSCGACNSDLKNNI
jgi:hypothetical protein